MKALVTGGTGFLGKRLAYKLKSIGYDVRIIGRNSLIGKQLENKGFQFLQTDIRDPETTIASCQGQDYVFHCAALSSSWGKYQNFYDTNVLGTRNIIQGSRIHGVQRLIFVSSSSVYFNFSHNLNIPESTHLPSKPANAYAKTKILAEQEIKEAHQSGLGVITIRPRAIFGSGENCILSKLIKAGLGNGILLINNGKVWIDITDVDNVVDALLLCKDAPINLLGRTFNITNGEPMYLIDLLENLSKKLGFPLKVRQVSYHTAYWLAALLEISFKALQSKKEPMLTRFTLGRLAFSQTLDIRASREELGYCPRVSVNEGLDAFTRWWKETAIH